MRSFFSNYRQRCLNEYAKLVDGNAKVDAGHSLNHVIKVEMFGSQALKQYLSMPDLKEWAERYPGSLKTPEDVEVRNEIACLLHEAGDHKLTDDQRPREHILGEIINRVAFDYPKNTTEFGNDIIRMIDLCSASKWGDEIPEGTKIYQLIPRWADRQEATGEIGLARCLIYSYSKRHLLAKEDESFPKTQEELEAVAPHSRYIDYSKGKASESAFGHLMDKIRHINGNDIPIPCLRKVMNDGQALVDQFILDFTNVNGKRFHLDWIIDRLDKRVYDMEVKQLEEMRDVMRKEKCKWLK